MALDTRPRVMLSAPKAENMSKPQRKFLSSLLTCLERKGFTVLPEPAMTDGLDNRFRKLRHSHGALVLALTQWSAERLYRERDSPTIMPSEFSHIEAAMAVAAEKPLLVLREKSLSYRGAFRDGYLPHVVKLPNSLDPEWFESSEFQSELNKWSAEVQNSKHVFLGYSSANTSVADKIAKFLTEKMGLRVFDWHDFRKGDSIRESIEQAECLTDCGVFLFMADDWIRSSNKGEFAPRDNVVFEAGYFAGAKGRKNSLIIREQGAKIPSDLGGILYVEMTDRNDIARLETPLRESIEHILDVQMRGE